jgi:hypothetical protein
MASNHNSEDWTGKISSPQEQSEFLDRWSNLRGGWYFLAFTVGAVILSFLYIWIFHA